MKILLKNFSYGEVQHKKEKLTSISILSRKQNKIQSNLNHLYFSASKQKVIKVRKIHAFLFLHNIVGIYVCKWGAQARTQIPSFCGDVMLAGYQGIIRRKVTDLKWPFFQPPLYHRRSWSPNPSLGTNTATFCLLPWHVLCLIFQYDPL